MFYITCYLFWLSYCLPHGFFPLSYLNGNVPMQLSVGEWVVQEEKGKTRALCLQHLWVHILIHFHFLKQVNIFQAYWVKNGHGLVSRHFHQKVESIFLTPHTGAGLVTCLGRWPAAELSVTSQKAFSVALSSRNSYVWGEVGHWLLNRPGEGSGDVVLVYQPQLTATWLQLKQPPFISGRAEMSFLAEPCTNCCPRTVSRWLIF